jgi:uncharacterized protein (DUF1330 family)
MVAYAIVDVEVYDIEKFLLYQKAVAPLLRAAGAKYLARGGRYRVYEGDYTPDSLIVLQFPSLEVMDSFYESDEYQALGAQREACSACRVIAVEGLDSPAPPAPPPIR